MQKSKPIPVKSTQTNKLRFNNSDAFETALVRQTVSDAQIYAKADCYFEYGSLEIMINTPKAQQSFVVIKVLRFSRHYFQPQVGIISRERCDAFFRTHPIARTLLEHNEGWKKDERRENCSKLRFYRSKVANW